MAIQLSIWSIWSRIPLSGRFPFQEYSAHSPNTTVNQWFFSPQHLLLSASPCAGSAKRPRLLAASEASPVEGIKRYWLVVSTHLKNISQNGSFPQVGTKITSLFETFWNHDLEHEKTPPLRQGLMSARPLRPLLQLWQESHPQRVSVTARPWLLWHNKDLQSTSKYGIYKQVMIGHVKPCITTLLYSWEILWQMQHAGLLWGFLDFECLSQKTWSWILNDSDLGRMNTQPLGFRNVNGTQ